MKILMICCDLPVNGIANVVLNYVTNLNIDKFQVEVAAGEPINDDYATELISRNIKLYSLPNRKKKTLEYRRSLKKIIKENKYDIVHMHGNSATMVLELSIAKKYKVPVRVAHCHNSTCGSMLRHKILLPFFKRSYTTAFACSRLAGDWIFGKDKFTVINNGFKTEKFKFNEEIRKSVRKKLGVEDKFLLGHIGRFNQQKNHPFLLKVFEKVAEKREDAYLLLVGGGPDFDTVKSLIDGHPYKEKIIVFGESNTPENLYNAMDVFLLPSLHEGLPVVLLEAQINGLPCIVADNITREVVLGNRIDFVPIDDPYKWSDAVNEVKFSDRNSFYKDFSDRIRLFDIDTCTKHLELKYQALCEQTK